MLQVESLRSGYGSLPVIDGVDLSLRQGEVTLLLGPNGSGKTTLLKTLAGFIRSDSGSVRLDGQDVTKLGVEARARMGLRLVLEEHRVFPDLTVEENLRLCSIGQFRGSAVARQIDIVTEPFPILRERLRSPARSLSGGQQQMLALSQAFMRPPSVLMCDEPSRGLASALLPDVLGFLQARAAEGTAVLIAEQMLEVALPIADRAILLAHGQVTLEGPAADVVNDRTVRRTYLGHDEDALAEDSL